MNVESPPIDAIIPFRRSGLVYITYRCPSSLYKRSPTKRGHLHRECGHQRSTCRYIHQATWWKEVLQAKEWVEHIGFLKYVLMHPPPTHMTCLSFEQSKVKVDWHDIHLLLRTWLVHLVTFSILLGPFKWFYFIRLIHENQMILISIWYHYCFYAWLDLVVAYDMFMGL